MHQVKPYPDKYMYLSPGLSLEWHRPGFTWKPSLTIEKNNVIKCSVIGLHLLFRPAIENGGLEIIDVVCNGIDRFVAVFICSCAILNILGPTCTVSDI